MNKIVVASDSFKGSLSSEKICEIAKEVIPSIWPQCDVVGVPVADGGEGTVDCFLACMNGEKIIRTVTGPLGDPVEAAYALFGSTAVIEMAAVAGLPLVKEPNPSRTTTYGVGELMLDAIQKGATQLIIALGGSCTNDGGCGCVAALGVRFFNEKEEPFVPVGGTLNQICRIQMGDFKNILKKIKIRVMCDVDNPMFGPNGAAYIFSPQKGANPDMVRELDRGLIHLHKLMKETLNKDVAELPGAGAAGAMGAGLVAFADAKLESGAELVLEVVNFRETIKGADLVITGEGKVDNQSLRGKVISAVCRCTREAGIPTVAVVGDVGCDREALSELGLDAVFSINRVAIPFEQSRLRSESDYRDTLENILGLLNAFH